MKAHRVAKVREALVREGLDAVIVTEPGSRFYLTGWATPDPQPGETAYWLIVDQQDLTILTGAPNKGEALEAVPSARFVGLGSSELAAVRTAAVVGDMRHRRVGFDDLYLAAGDFRLLSQHAPQFTEWVAVPELVRNLRAVKEPEEIEILRTAIKITDEAYESMREWLKPGTTEREVARFIERYSTDHGADEVAFGVLVGSGPNSASIHHHATDRPIQSGDPCWIDFGAKIGGYSADLSRAFCLGPASDRLIALYDAVIAALDLNVAGLTVGSNGKDIARQSSEELERRGFSVGHFGGHGIGLQVHEPPFLDRGLPILVEENVVVTADPGVYITGWGGMRIEEDVLVTANGPEILTKATRDLVISVA
jgi:Xaa-Pro aminopeptidase